MFTGIVQTQAEVVSAENIEGILKLKIVLAKAFIANLTIGASVANNGVCLTVVEFGLYDENNAYMCFDIIDETLRVTNLGKLKIGDSINIERSLKVGDEIGGHIVSGHIQCMAALETITAIDDNCAMQFTVPKQVIKYIVSKGFITVNGTSLTVGQVIDKSFIVHLIPETLKITNLSKLALGDFVNIELDQQTVTIVQTIERLQTQKAI